MKWIVYLFMGLSLFGANLRFVKGEVKAHTSVFGDSHIDPKSKYLESHLTIKDRDLKSIRGVVKMPVKSLKSENSKRDEHMYDMFEADKYPVITVKIENIKKDSNSTLIFTKFTIHGVTRDVVLKGNIKDKNNLINIKAKGSIKVTSFGMKPPRLLFLTVRDRVDLFIDTYFEEK